MQVVSGADIRSLVSELSGGAALRILVDGQFMHAALAAGHGGLRFGTSGQGEGTVFVRLGGEQVARHGGLLFRRFFPATMHTERIVVLARDVDLMYNLDSRTRTMCSGTSVWLAPSSRSVVTGPTSRGSPSGFAPECGQRAANVSSGSSLQLRWRQILFGFGVKQEEDDDDGRVVMWYDVRPCFNG